MLAFAPHANGAAAFGSVGIWFSILATNELKGDFDLKL